MSKETKHFYDFGNFRLDPSEKVLLCGGEFISITPKVFETLRFLVENAGRLVEKDELMQQIWHDQFVEESNLSFNIKMLRKALGDNAQNPRFVKTVPTRGYRFIAEVRRVEAEVTQPGVEEEAPVLQLNDKQAASENFSPPVNQREVQRFGAVVTLANWRQEAKGTTAEEEVPPPISSKESTEQTTVLDSPHTKPNVKIRQKPKDRRLPAVIALTILLIGAVALGYYFFGHKSGSTVADGKKSIAVLPIKPINTDDRNEIYEIGIADSLIHRLSSMKGFVVRPLSATRQYTNIDQDPLAAGKEQQVDYVFYSNYQLADGKIRVTAQLFNVANGQVEDTYKSEKDALDVFGVQDAIAGEVGNLLLSRFTTTALNNPTAKRGTDNEEAYRL